MSLSRAFVDPEPVADVPVGESLGDQGGYLFCSCRRVNPGGSTLRPAGSPRNVLIVLTSRVVSPP